MYQKFIENCFDFDKTLPKRAMFIEPNLNQLSKLTQPISTNLTHLT